MENTPPPKVDFSNLDLNNLPTDVAQLHSMIIDLAEAMEDTLLQIREIDPDFCASEVEPALLESLTPILKK